MLKIIKLIIGFLVVLFLILGSISLFGIKIDKFSFGDFSISQLYLKFDKKLILEVKEIVIKSKETESEGSLDNIIKNISNLENALKIFKKINIERLKIKDNEFTIFLDEKILYLDNKYVNISANLDINGHQVSLDLYSIYLKDTNLTLFGKTKVDLSKKVMNFFGDYHLNDIEGKLNAQLTEKYLDFYVDSVKNVKSIKFLKKFFRLDEIAESWMYDNVKGDINLKYLYGKIDLAKKEPIMSSIKGEASIKNAKIRFNKKAKPVDTEELVIKYKNDKLSFDLKNPVYNKTKIYGSKVFITDLTSEKKGMVFVILKTKSILNNDILEVLDSYDIKLPLKQLSGDLDSSLLLKIPYSSSKKMKVDGTFKAKNSAFKLKNFEFFAKKADVILKDSDVFIKNSQLEHKNMLVANLDLKIDTKKSFAKGKAYVNYFEIKNNDEESIVRLKDFKTNLDIDFNTTTKLDIKALNTKLDIKKDYISIDILDLNKIYPHSKFLNDLDISNGDLKVKFFDKDLIKFHVNAKKMNLPFEQNGNKITKLSANGVIKNNIVKIETDDRDIEIIIKNKKNTLLKLNNVDLNLNMANSAVTKKLPNIDLYLKNSTIKLDEEHSYKTQWADIHIKNSKVSFEGKALDLNLPISKNGKKITTLEVLGEYENNILDIKTRDKKLELLYNIPKEKIFMSLNSYDVMYYTSQETNEDMIIAFYINGVNSNIIINDKHVAKATKYKFTFEELKTNIDLQYNSTKFKYNKNFKGDITLSAQNMNDDFLNALFGKNLIKDGFVSIKALGKNGRIDGSAFIKGSKVVDLAILNNLILFINTSPGLINPLLAIPSFVGMATNKGFNLNGYRIVDGKVDFNYDFNTKFLNMYKIKTKGNGIDFNGFIGINFKNLGINGKLKLIFFKDYSKIVGAIPVVNYVILGDKKKLDTEVSIYGKLDDPKYKTAFVKEGFSAPVNIIKRIISSPFKLFESMTK